MTAVATAAPAPNDRPDPKLEVRIQPDERKLRRLRRWIARQNRDARIAAKGLN